MKVKDFIKFVNNAIDTTVKIEADDYEAYGELYTLDDFEELIKNSTECSGVEKIASELEIEIEDFYSCATDVYKCEDGYVGIHAGLQLFSEQMDWSDACPDTCVSEYEAVQTVTYKPKKCHS